MNSLAVCRRRGAIVGRMHAVIASLAVTSVAATLAACAGGGDGPTPPPQAISIALSAATLSIQQGQNGTVTVTVGRLNGFAAAVTLTLEGAPTGVTGAFNPTPVPNGTTSSTLTITVGATAAAGPHTLTVRGRGQGVTDQTATLALTITAAPPTLALALNPTSLSVQQGQSGTSTATITRGGSFTGAVDLTAEGVPAGVTVSFNPASIPANATTSTVTVTVAASAAAGSSNITVRARGTGVTDQTAALALTVTAAPTYTLAVTPTSANVPQGANTTVQVSLTRDGGFTGGVTLSLEGAPAGVTSSFSPNPATGNTSTLTITVGASVAPGTYTLTVKGTATGLTDRTATFTLQVTGGGGSGNVSFRFCATPLPVWVASQDGTGPWTRVVASANNTYTFTIGARGGVAIVTPQENGYSIEVIYATGSELATFGPNWDGDCTFTAPGTKQLNGTVAGVGASEEAEVALGPAGATVVPPNASYTLNAVPDGALDLVAVRGMRSAFVNFNSNKLIIRRSVNLPNGSSIPVLDFNGTEAVAPVSANLTINNLGSDVPNLFVSYSTATATDVILTARLGVAGATQGYQGVPSSAQAASDLHDVLIFAGPADPSATTSRFLATFFKAPGDHALTLGPDVAQPTVGLVASSPYLRHRAQLPIQPEYKEMAFAVFAQEATDRSASVFITAGYVGTGASTWDLSVPDLTGAANFDANWGPRPGTPTDWVVAAAGGSLFAIPTEGTTVRFATRFGSAAAASIASRSALGAQSALRVLRPLRPRAAVWRETRRQR
jgi:hypothetical protein